MTERPIRIDRLRKLAEFLREVPKENFDYCIYASGLNVNQVDLYECGTTACAVGWATQIPEFGLEVAFSTDIEKVYISAPLMSLNFMERNFHIRPSLRSAMWVFGLTREQAEYLFYPEALCFRELPSSPGAGATPTEVAAHIERFCAYMEELESIDGTTTNPA